MTHATAGLGAGAGVGTGSTHATTGLMADAAVGARAGIHVGLRGSALGTSGEEAVPGNPSARIGSV